VQVLQNKRYVGTPGWNSASSSAETEILLFKYGTVFYLDELI